MKKYLLILPLLLGACAIQGEVFRLQNRMNSWYALLDDAEELLFSQNNITELGLSLDNKETNNQEFAQSLRNVRINESILSFDGVQTAHFFYNILLKDLSKFSYEEFITSLTPEEKVSFSTESNLSAFLQKNNIFQNAKSYYGFRSFTDEQILDYYKNLSFPANYYPVIYDSLAFLARYRSMEVFLQGDINQTMQVFENIQQLVNSRRIPVRTQGERDLKTWQDIKKRVYFEDLSDEQFLNVLYNVIPQLDNTVRITTIDNIKNRFKEQ